MHVLLDVLRGWARGKEGKGDVLRGWARGKGCSHEIWVWLGKISSGIYPSGQCGTVVGEGRDLSLDQIFLEELVLKSGLSQFTQIAYIIPFMCQNVLENLIFVNYIVSP